MNQEEKLRRYDDLERAFCDLRAGVYTVEGVVKVDEKAVNKWLKRCSLIFKEGSSDGLG